MTIIEIILLLALIIQFIYFKKINLTINYEKMIDYEINLLGFNITNDELKKIIIILTIKEFIIIPDFYNKKGDKN